LWREIHPWCETRGHGAHSFALGDRGFESVFLQRRVTCEPDFLALSLAVSLTCSGIPRIEPSRAAGGTPALWRPMTARLIPDHDSILGARGPARDLPLLHGSSCL
jgi:hypothetical protein